MPRLLRSCNIAVGTAFVSAVGMYTWCDQRRREEAKGIDLAMRGLKAYNQKQAREEKEEKLKAIAEEARGREQELSKKSWYKVW
jgi:actin-related protein